MTNEDQKLKETLSALLDGEAGKIDQLELRRLARALEERPELLEVYRRYTLTQALMKGDHVEAIQTDVLLTRVRAALAGAAMDEPEVIESYTSRNASVGRDWLLAAGRMAIAASVAIVAVHLVQLRTSSAEPPLTAAAPVVASTTAALTAPIAQNTRFVNPDLLTVSAGGHQDSDARAPDKRTQTNLAGCVISPQRSDNSNLLWEKNLPAGYVLCKQDAQTRQCESFSSTVSCYQE